MVCQKVACVDSRAAGVCRVAITPAWALFKATRDPVYPLGPCTEMDGADCVSPQGRTVRGHDRLEAPWDED